MLVLSEIAAILVLAASVLALSSSLHLLSLLLHLRLLLPPFSFLSLKRGKLGVLFRFAGEFSTSTAAAGAAVSGLLTLKVSLILLGAAVSILPSSSQ